jgi:hypothetical protein
VLPGTSSCDSHPHSRKASSEQTKPTASTCKVSHREPCAPSGKQPNHSPRVGNPTHKYHSGLNIVATLKFKFFRIVSCLSPWRPAFDPRPVHVELAVNKVALGQLPVRVLQVSPVSVIPPTMSLFKNHF